MSIARSQTTNIEKEDEMIIFSNMYNMIYRTGKFMYDYFHFHAKILWVLHALALRDRVGEYRI
jgi:hypothetical protein